MGCHNSTLKRRNPTPKSIVPEDVSILKESKSEFIVDDKEISEHSTVDRSSDQPPSDSATCRESNQSSRCGRFSKYPRPSTSALPSKLFKRTNKAPKKSRTSSETSKTLDVEKSLDDVECCKRQLSIPILATPSIVVDEAPPSAPPNGAIGACSNNVMWDVLTSVHDSQAHQPANGTRQNRFPNFGRRRSDGKLVSQMKSADSVTEDWVLKIIRCFPFPSPKQSPRSSPPPSPRDSTTADRRTVDYSASLAPPPTTSDSSTAKPRSRSVKLTPDPPKSNAFGYSALGLMVRRTIETAFPPLIPWDVWLRKRLANWTQCSGHEGTVVPATEKTVWKKCAADSNEAKVYQRLMDDAAAAIVPKFYKQVDYKDQLFMELEDLSRNFVDPCIMDIKMGTRTFLESEVQNQKKRPDLYDKMIAIDPEEPSASEHEEKAITKLRYMTFREQRSSSAALGFRIDAAKMSGATLQKDFQKVRTREQIKSVLRVFLQTTNLSLYSALLDRLQFIREKIEQSEFFQSHQVIGSSILIIHDSKSVDAWIIDFAKVISVEPDRIDHRSAWILGNHEDGYLFGLDNLIEIVQELESENDAS